MLSALGMGAPEAQTLRKAAPPAEFPPLSYKGKQYVDSRGCIYVRAGINGNVTWVPRVSRSRKQICGYKPTDVAGTRPATAPKTAGKPVIITLEPSPEAAPKPTRPSAPKIAAKPAPATPAAKPAVRTKPQRTAAAPTPAPAPAPKPVVKPRPAPAIVKAQPKPAKPTRTARVRPQRKPQAKPSPRPAPTVFSSAKTAAPKPAAPAKVRTVARVPWYKRPLFKSQRKPSPAPAPTVMARPAKTPTPAPIPAPVAAPVRVASPAPARIRRQAGTGRPGVKCPNASVFSQQYINDPAGRYRVRCGPQAEPPVTYGRAAPQSTTAAAPTDPNTRVVRRHIFDNRQNTTNVSVPKGYRTVWNDDRLNPHRAERSLRPAQTGNGVRVPKGYRRVVRGDDRLNTRRGIRTARGDASSSRIWSNTVPRVLLPVATQPRVVTVPKPTARAQVTRLSTRSSPAGVQGGKRLYIRVAVYAGDADARAVAKALARQGLPMNLGQVKSSGNKVVLAGPFATDAGARAALGKVRQAGFAKARLSK